MAFSGYPGHGIYPETRCLRATLGVPILPPNDRQNPDKNQMRY